MKSLVEHAGDVASAFPPYPVAVQAGALVFLTGIRGAGKGFADIPDIARARAQGFTAADLVEGEVAADAWRIHERMETVLRAIGSSNDLLLRQHMWQRNKSYFPAYEQIRKIWQKAPAPSSGLGVSSIVGNRDGWLGLDAIAARPSAQPDFSAITVTAPPDSARLPSAAHYSQSLSWGPLMFLAGHIPIDTRLPGKPLVTSFDALDERDRFLQTGRSHTDARQGPIAVQATFVYNEIRRHLEDHAHALHDVVHVTVFLQRQSDYAVFHKVHRHFFGDGGPSLTIATFDEVGHKACLVEIETTVLRRDTWTRQAVPWTAAPPVAAPAATIVGNLVFFSGMIGLTDAGRLARSVHDVPPEGARLVGLLESAERRPGIAAQCWLAWQRLADAMTAASVSADNLLKITLYVSDPADLIIHEVVRQQFVSSHLPAFECVCVQGPGGLPGGDIQIEAIGLK